MLKVSERLASLSPSATLAMAQKSSELKAQGVDIISLSVGEPDFFTPHHIKEAAKKAIDDNYSFYTPVAGYPELRQAISDKLRDENQLDYPINQIVCSNGAKQALSNVLLSIIGRGDEVIIPAPYWVSYPEMVKMADGTPIIVPANIDADFKITAEQLEKAITPQTKALMLCSPSNPTGSVYTYDELKSLVDVLAKHPNIVIVSDEIYEHINYADKHISIAHFPEVFERTVIINGVSKAYAMTGWRSGWMAGPKWIADACVTLQGQYSSNPSSIAQMAAVAAYRGDQTCLTDMKTAFERRKNLVVGLARKIEGFKVNEPKGAFYIFPDCSYYFGKKHNDSTINTPEDLALFLLAEAHVACVGGTDFGDPNCIRMSYATSDEQLIEAFRRIEEALIKLK